MVMAYQVKKRWSKLYSSSIYRKKKLEPLKIEYGGRKMTQIQSFNLQVKVMNKKKTMVKRIKFKIVMLNDSLLSSHENFMKTDRVHSQKIWIQV